jgi:hypothetical protein
MVGVHAYTPGWGFLGRGAIPIMLCDQRKSSKSRKKGETKKKRKETRELMNKSFLILYFLDRSEKLINKCF